MQKKHEQFKLKPTHQHKDLEFPKDFLWGTATSAHQVEGWNDNNDWWEWEHLPGAIVDGQMSGRSADHYHKYKEDFDILEKLHQNAYRMSIEWSRINPEPGVFDEKQVRHYVDVLKDLKKRNIKVMLTLHHFTLPIWFANMGGFEKRKNVDYFIEFVEYIVPKVKDYVDFWVTINEPNVYVLMSYLLGLWPPGKTGKLAALKAFNNLEHAHKRAYNAIHEACAPEEVLVGIAHNATSFYLYDKHSLSEWLSLRFADWVWNHWFIEKTKGYHDFLGINYYVHKRVKGVGLTNWEKIFAPSFDEGRELTDLDWEIFAPGFYDVLVDMGLYELPIYITENGISSLNDHQRARYIISYLKELYHAINSGIDVRGYFYWSLMDNFEWDKGLLPRFGLVEIDYKTLKRKIRGSAYIYRNICQDSVMEHDLLRFIGHGVDPKEIVMPEK